MLFQAGRYKGSEEELPPFMAPRKGDPCPKEEEGSLQRIHVVLRKSEALKIIFLLVFNL